MRRFSIRGGGGGGEKRLFRIDSFKRDGWMDGDATMRCEDDDADRDDNLTR